MRKIIDAIGLHSGWAFFRQARGSGRTVEMLKKAVLYSETEREPVAIIIAYSHQKQYTQDQLVRLGADFKDYWYYIFSVETFPKEARGLPRDIKLFFDHAAIELMRKDSIRLRDEALAAFDQEQEFLNRLAEL